MNEEFSEEDLINHRLNKARVNFAEAKGAAKAGFLNSSINRLYYSCFYALTALLFKENINAKTHSGVRHMLGLHFIETGKISRELGKFYSTLFESRQQNDYEDFFVIEDEFLIKLISETEEFIATIEAHIANGSENKS